MKKITLAALALTGLMAASSAFAADPGKFYVYGGIGQTTGSNDKSNLDGDLYNAGAYGFNSNMSTPTLFKLQAGYQITPNFAVEAGYLDSNNETYTAIGGNIPRGLSASASVDAWNITAVGIIPLGSGFSLFGKVGIADTHESGSVSAGGYSVSLSGSKTDATYGIGAQYNINKQIFTRFDLESYNVGTSDNSSRTSIWAFDFGYNF